jgi:Ca2+-binding RTX toxin-like protein
MASSDNSTTGDTDVPANIFWVGGPDNEVKYGGAGDDFLDGGAGDDSLTGDAGNDTFSCNDGLDHVYDLGNGTDVLNVNCWGSVVAELFGDWFSDIWSNNDGKATLIANNYNVDVSLAEGTQGWTITNADNEHDVVFVGSILNDTLVGGYGDDILTGSNGADTFVFGGLTWGHDIITDFVSDEDKLDFLSLGLHDISDFGVEFNGDDTVITMGVARIITVQNVHLTSNDFLYA